MDWSRAKSILIAVFLLLNIFLIFIIIYTNTNFRFQSDYVGYAKEYLVSKNITFHADIPDKNGKAGKIVYSERLYDYKRLMKLVFGSEISAKTADDKIQYINGSEEIIQDGEKLLIKDSVADGESLFSDTEIFESKIYYYLANTGYPKSSLSLQSSTETDSEKKLEFVLKYRNALLFDQIISVTLNKEGMLSVILPFREPERENDSVEIISAYQILVMGDLPQDSFINSMEFGYKRLNEEDRFESPVWRVIINDITCFYNAYTGEKIE